MREMIHQIPELPMLALAGVAAVWAWLVFTQRKP